MADRTLPSPSSKPVCRDDIVFAQASQDNDRKDETTAGAQVLESMQKSLSSTTEKTEKLTDTKASPLTLTPELKVKASDCLSERKRGTSSVDKADLLSSGKKARKERDEFRISPASFTSHQGPSEYLDEDLVQWARSLQALDSECLSSESVDHRRWSFASDLSRNLPSLVHRCMVHQISRQYQSLFLSLTKTVTNERILVVLSGTWARTEVKHGDLVNVVSALHEQEGELTARIDHTAGFLIIHPDTLISGSSLPLGNECVRRGYLRQWMVEQSAANDKIVFGNIMHKVMQEAFTKHVPYNGEPLVLNKEINKIVESSVEDLIGCEKSEEDILHYIEEKLPLIQTWLKLYASPASKEKIKVKEVLDVEESVYAPQFGLKGRIDVTLSVTSSTSLENRSARISKPSCYTNPRCSSVKMRSPASLSVLRPIGPQVRTEQEGGQDVVMPMEFKTGKPWFSHDAQVLLYLLLLEARHNTEVEEGLLWYLGPPTQTKQIKMKKNELDNILQARNYFASFIKEIQTCLPPMLQSPRVCERCPYLTECATLHKALENGDTDSSGMGEMFDLHTRHLNTEHLNFLQRWIPAVNWEEAESKRKEPFSWNPDKEACKAAGIISMRSLRLHRVHQSHSGTIYTFQGIRGQESLQVDEFVLVSIEHWQTGILKGFIRYISEDSISVTADAILPQKWQDKKYKWRLDKFYSTRLTAMQRTNLMQLVVSQEPSIAKLRSLIIDKRPPQKTKQSSLMKDKSLDSFTEGLNSDQKAAVLHILEEHEYSLIWGMPGSGKTHTTAQAIQGLVTRKLSILVSSYTHSAVDNILIRLKNLNVKFLRLGSKSHVHENIHDHLLGSAQYSDTSTSGLKRLIEEIQVVGVTCSSARHPLLVSKRFDICIIDEASQIPFPVLLAPLMKARSFVLIGDPNQLPPLVKTEEALELKMDETLFTILQTANPQTVVPLRLQYRMCEKIMELANHLVYNNELVCANEAVSNQHLQLTRKEDPEKSYVGEWCAQILDPELHVLMADTSYLQFHDEQKSDSCINNGEARLVKDLIATLINRDLLPESIGVISPYNGQIRAIQSFLKADDHQFIEVSTVDKFQGRDKDCIIVSFVRSNKEKETGGLLSDWRRINVAITRARKKLILIGDINTLSTDPFLKKMINYLKDQDCIRTLTERK